MKIYFHFKKESILVIEINELSLDPKKSNNIYIKAAITEIINNEIISFPNKIMPCQITTPIIKDLIEIFTHSLKGNLY